MSNQVNPLSQAESWSRVAEGYAEMADWVMSPFAKKAIEISNITPASRVLDVACGSGILTCMLSNQVKEIHALDFSHDMLNELKKRLLKRELFNVETLEADGQNLPFDDNQFDHAFSLFGLMFFPDRIKGFKELHRVLRPGSAAIISSWAPLEKSTLMQTTGAAINSALPDAPSPRANSRSLENPEIFKAEMEEAGFENVLIQECAMNLPAISTKMFWKLMSEGGAPIALLQSKYSADEWHMISTKIMNYLHETYKESPIQLMTTAYFGIGIKKS